MQAHPSAAIGDLFGVTPGQETEAALRLAPQPAEGVPGVSTLSTNPLGSVNRDKTGERMVRKGVTVDYFGLRCRVERVRKGTAYCRSLVSGAAQMLDCHAVQVVA